MMKRFSNAAITLLLAAFVALGLAACAEDAPQEDIGAGPDTAQTGQGDRGQQGDMGQRAAVQRTISLLRQGVLNIAVNQAVQNINGWQQRLQGTPALQGIYNNLGQLKNELTADQIDGQAVGSLLSQLGQQTTQAASNASGLQVQQLRQLGQVLTQAGNRLTGQGGSQQGGSQQGGSQQGGSQQGGSESM